MPRRNLNGNLIQNGDFGVYPGFVAATNTSARYIDGTAGGSAATLCYTKWGIISGTTNGTFSAQFDNTVSYSGGASMKLSIPATGSALEVGPLTAINLGNLQRTCPVVNGSTSYFCSYRMKTQLISGSSANGAFVNLNERNGTGAGSVTNNSVKVLTTTDWTFYTMTITTASATRFIVPRISLIGTGGSADLIMNIWIDDFYLYPAGNVIRTPLT